MKKVKKEKNPEKKKRGKKIVLIIVTVVVAIMAFATMNGFDIGMGTLTFGVDKVITTAPGEVIPQGTSFTMYGKMSGSCTQKGTVERIEYTTGVYEDGVTYNKYFNVYLPYGYDQNDTSKKYNVIYFQHGNTNDPDLFMTMGDAITWFDNLFASGKAEPAIVVFPTFYMDVTKDVETRKRTGNVPAGDGGWDGLPANYYLEVTQDIIPLVESKYNTYTESFDEEGLKASRDHRCFAGYSRGGAVTWNMFHDALEYFKWYAPMSCHSTAGGKISRDNMDHSVAFAYLKEAIDAHPELDFYIYAASGNASDAPMLREQMKYFIEQTDVFSYGNDPAVNNLYYTISDFRHADLYAPYYFYNILQVVFH